MRLTAPPGPDPVGLTAHTGFSTLGVAGKLFSAKDFHPLLLACFSEHCHISDSIGGPLHHHPGPACVKENRLFEGNILLIKTIYFSAHSPQRQHALSCPEKKSIY
jgi:hypothetical protein